jgi:hypothetical protein
VHVRWGGKKSKHSNYFHHGFFMVPLVASIFGNLHPGRLVTFSLELRACRWQSSRSDWWLVIGSFLFDLYRTGEVRHGNCGTDDEATKIQKAIFLKLKASSDAGECSDLSANDGYF